jgi:hypothetical protein
MYKITSNVATARLRRAFIATGIFIKKEERSQLNDPPSTLRPRVKESILKPCRKKEGNNKDWKSKKLRIEEH